MSVPSFNFAPGETSEATRSRRKYAQDLLEQGTQSGPVRHWSQGLERIAKAMMGGWELGKIEREEKAKEAAAIDLVKQHPALQGGTSAAPTGIQRVAAALANAQGSQPSTAGKLYNNDEPSPLDPPSGADRDMAVRTVIAEAGNQPQVGREAVANVLRNRAVNGGFGGDQLPGVIQKSNQFEPWNTAQGRGRMAAIDPNSPGYAQAGQAVDAAYSGAPDPTRGATHFYAPKAQASLGRPAPAWDNGRGADIGDHRFFGGAGTPPVMAGATPSDVSAQQRPQQQSAQPAPGASGGIPPQMRDYINRLIANPATRGYGVTLLGQYTAPKDAEFGDIGTDPNTGHPQKGWINKQSQTVTPAAIPGQQQSNGPSTIPAPPAGVDPKIWREGQSKRATEQGMPASWDDTSKLRREIQDLPSYKNLAQAAPVYKSMLDAAGRDNRAADVNLIYGMAKIMDPGSVVRESEMTVAQAVATLPEQLKAAVWSQLEGSGRLSQNVREAIMQEAHSRVGSYQQFFNQDTGMYRGIAERNRMNTQDVVPDFGQFEPYRRPASAPQLDWRGQPAGGWINVAPDVRIREKVK